MEEVKTHWKKMLNYDYLGAYSLDNNQDLTVTITGTARELVKSAQHPKGEDCFTAQFKEVDKPMILNATNCKTIQGLYGAFIEDWVGKQVTLYVKDVKAFGTVTDALRIRDFEPKAKNVDVKGATEILAKAKTLDELKEAYKSLPKDQMNNEEVIEYKNSLKTILL
jgi:hypothetical protein